MSLKGLSADRYRLMFAVLLVLYGLYAAAFIWRTSFVIDGTRYFCLFDDVMGTMRYAKNLVNGYGLVWNPGGPRVEEYNNLLWVVYLSLFHLLRIPEAIISLPIQGIAALCLVINLVVVKKIVELLVPNAALVALGPAFLTAFFLPLNTWGLLGTEVS